jgi:hypothetical protein
VREEGTERVLLLKLRGKACSASFQDSSIRNPFMRAHFWGSAAVIALGFLPPTSASACDFYLAYGPLGSQSARISIGAGVQVFPWEEETETGFTPTLSVGVRLGSRFVVRPAVGYCSYGRDEDLIAGTGAAVTLVRSEAGSFGIQGHAARVDLGEGSAIVIPLLAVANFDLGDGGSLQAGVGIRYSRLTFDESDSDSGAAAFVGATVPRIPVRRIGNLRFRQLFAFRPLAVCLIR